MVCCPMNVWLDIKLIGCSQVSRPPLFFKETNPQPRKHTLWQATSDFTGGQATTFKSVNLAVFQLVESLYLLY
jgi:hypothetical protein